MTRVVVRGRGGSRAAQSREQDDPRAHRDEGERLEHEGGDDREDHGCCAEDEQDRRDDHVAACAGSEAADADRAQHERDERDGEGRRGDAVSALAHGERDHAQDDEARADSRDRDADRVLRATTDLRAHPDRQDESVGGEQRARHDQRAVEDVPREVVVGAQLRVVQVPPFGVARRAHRQRDPDHEDEHRQGADAMGSREGARARPRRRACVEGAGERGVGDGDACEGWNRHS